MLVKIVKCLNDQILSTATVAIHWQITNNSPSRFRNTNGVSFNFLQNDCSHKRRFFSIDVLSSADFSQFYRLSWFDNTWVQYIGQSKALFLGWKQISSSFIWYYGKSPFSNTSQVTLTKIEAFSSYTYIVPGQQLFSDLCSCFSLDTCTVSYHSSIEP